MPAGAVRGCIVLDIWIVKGCNGLNAWVGALRPLHPHDTQAPRPLHPLTYDQDRITFKVTRSPPPTDPSNCTSTVKLRGGGSLPAGHSTVEANPQQNAAEETETTLTKTTHHVARAKGATVGRTEQR
jgi:hypothetical protein